MDQLVELTADELDERFRSGTAGEIPGGEGRGTILLGRGGELSEIAAKLARYIVWQGKVFDRADGVLLNEVTPFGVRAVIARVFRGDSWFDGAPCIVLDYSKTSLIAHWIRDEIRQIAPGLYLGVVFWERDRILHFALEFEGDAGR